MDKNNKISELFTYWWENNITQLNVVVVAVVVAEQKRILVHILGQELLLLFTKYTHNKHALTYTIKQSYIYV